MTAAVQTLWAELVVGSLADAGVTTCVVSPGSRSTPLVAALVADGRFELPAIIDERAAAFFALGVARATGVPIAMVCTSGTAAAHYLPAIVEASEAGVPLVAITADRPPELQHCGAAQTVDQIKLYGSFVRAAFDLGAPVGSAPALRAVRRTVLQAVATARGPHPGPVHIEVPLRKPLESVPPQTADEHALYSVVAELRREPVVAAAPRLTADPAAVAALGNAIAAEPRGVIVVGAMSPTFVGDAVLELAVNAGYPVLAEVSSGVRRRSRRDVTFVEHFDLALGCADLAGAPLPALVIQIGAEPVAASWSTGQLTNAARWVLSDRSWHDPDASAHGIVLGDVAATCAALCERIGAAGGSDKRRAGSFAAQWGEVSTRMVAAAEHALAAHPSSEAAILRAALTAVPDGATIQLGNSLPIRVVDHVWTGGNYTIIAQRGAAGIDGMIASATGATHRGTPVLLIVGDVSFAHDLGGLLAARHAKAPLAIVVVDNGGGRIFESMPISRATSRATFERYFAMAPGVDPTAVATSLGIRAITATTPEAAFAAVTAALATPGPTVIHAPVTATGASDFRRSAIELALRPTRPLGPSNGANHA